jgi:hypothetical protein
MHRNNAASTHLHCDRAIFPVVLHLLTDCVAAAAPTTAAANTSVSVSALISQPTHASPLNNTTTTTTVRPLKELTVEEIGDLMVAVNMTPLQGILLSHNVSGLMLHYCDAYEELLSAEYGLTTKGLARGLFELITEWKANGVPVS